MIRDIGPILLQADIHPGVRVLGGHVLGEMGERDRPAPLDPSDRGLERPRDEVEHRGLARAVDSDDPDPVTAGTDLVSNLNLSGAAANTVYTFAQKATKQVISKGRYGILVDMPATPDLLDVSSLTPFFAALFAFLGPIILQGFISAFSAPKKAPESSPPPRDSTFSAPSFR